MNSAKPSKTPGDIAENVKDLIVKLDHRGYTHAYVSKEWLQEIYATLKISDKTEDK